MNLTQFSNYHDALASTSTASDGVGVALWTVSPLNETAALFQEPSIQPIKKRSRSCLCNYTNIDLALAAPEGVLP